MKCQNASWHTDWHSLDDRYLQSHNVLSETGFLWSGETKSMNIWPNRLNAADRARNAPTERSRFCAVSAAVCCSNTNVLMCWEPGSSDKGQFLSKGRWADRDAYSRLCGDWPVWCSARRKHAQQRYNASPEPWFFSFFSLYNLHVDLVRMSRFRSSTFIHKFRKLSIYL